MVYAVLFTFAYLPQVIFLLIFHGPVAWLNGAFLVLGEGAIVIQCLFEAFMCDETLVDVFDSVGEPEAFKRTGLAYSDTSDLGIR